jgi:hypothetical protein
MNHVYNGDVYDDDDDNDDFTHLIMSNVCLMIKSLVIKEITKTHM